MNKTEFNKLRWKYFWQQKAKEISQALLLILISSIIFGGVIGIILFIDWITSLNLIILLIIKQILGGIFLIGGGGFCIICICVGIVSWLRDNMKKAEARARKELK